MNKQILAYLYNGMLSSNENEQNIDRWKNLNETKKVWCWAKEWQKRVYTVQSHLFVILEYAK